MNETIRLHLKTLLGSLSFSDLPDHIKGSFRWLFVTSVLKDMENDLALYDAYEGQRKFIKPRIQSLHDQFLTYTGAGFYTITEQESKVVLSRVREILDIEEDEFGRPKIAYDERGHSKDHPLP